MYKWIDAPDALNGWLGEQPQHAPVFVDTEFMRTNTFRSRLALAQVNLDGAIALLDMPRLETAAALADRLNEPDGICVMHSASEDLEALSAVLPDGPANLFDTQIAAAMVGLGFGLSYQKLVAELLGIELPKAETRSDWMKRPLTDSQLEYAAQDVAHLPQLHASLDERLQKLDRRAWLIEDCRRMVERVCKSPPDPQPQRALRGAAQWPIERQALLRRVLLWRETTARKLDKPRPWILDDARALSLVAEPPVESRELFERSKGLRALRGEQRQQLFELLRSPLQSDELDIVPVPAALNSPQKRQIKAMRDEVTRIAVQLDIPEGLLCSRRHLQSLVGENVWPEALEGWRKPLLHDALMAKLD